MSSSRTAAESTFLRVVFVGDIHMGPNSETRPGEETPDLLAKFVMLVNDEIRPDLVIEMGDRVNNNSHELDMGNAARLGAILQGLRMPRLHAIGNHDVHYLSKEENEQVLGGPVRYRAQTVSGYRLVFVDTTEPVIEHIGGNVSRQQLEWLRAELTSSDMPKLVLGHHPVDEQNMDGNPHFVKFPELAHVKNKKQVMDALTTGRNVVAYINGHVHWFHFFVDGDLPCISLPSFTEAWPESKNAPGMFAEAVFWPEGGFEVAVRSLNPDRVIGRFCWKRRPKRS